MDEIGRASFEQAFNVSRETMERLDRFVELLTRENETQNLVSSASLADVWNRHIADSAQLLRFALATGSWVDLGTGAGFPGLVIGLLRREKTVLVEQRKLRADFLRRAIDLLEIGDRCEVREARVERLVPEPFSVISARAFAPLGKLLQLATPLATSATIWVLPKGRNAQTELEAALASWQGIFRLEPSVTDPEAGIIVAEQVRRRKKGKG